MRWDGGIETGSVVGLSYDPMLAKLIVFARTREQAIARMQRALEELMVVGVETSREFHLRVMADEEYRRGAVDIQWLEQKLPALLAVRPPKATVTAAAIAAALIADVERRARTGNGGPTPAGAPGAANGAASGDAAGRAPDTGRSAWAEQARREALRDT